jgi:large subunit ribosomal protein L3
MTLGIIGRKIGMTHVFEKNGAATPVTVIQAGPCKVVQKKTVKNDGYNAIQIGFESAKESRLSKAENGHFSKRKVSVLKTLKEIRLSEQEIVNYKEGDEINVSAFEKIAFLDITGTSKGRGYSGVIKRHNFHMPKATHGTHEKFRHGGSLGCRFPQHVIKGKKMAGHYGNERTTIQNIPLHTVRKEENIILVKGSIPGPNNRIVLIRSALKKPTL